MKSTTDIADTRTDADAFERDALRAVAHGDRAAFERLYLRHHAPLARFIARHTARRDLIDEVINDTFWIVWRKAGEFRGDSKVGTWIIGIAYRCMLKSLRSHAPVPEAADIDTDDALPGGAESSESETRELADWVRRGLALLPPEQRTTMELAYYLGQSCEEIAAIMNCATGTVKARMFHARLRLRNTLPALGGDAAQAIDTRKQPS
ncbi:RNA polymerase sigma factor [Tahibacter soli]|uniref:Sigma-70 family RNA polymerase sigma factor n=1 Tax=Tahibacter soli TaxID=2983605 RepID=A0A9X4BHQ7_9GAMM|nr:sigma-70 family RNA polymerase sigma factor [Tahibacter soli]MDC8014475.1 sigma-70 family RNA polymerase sigma factor [Tahibacter soli]